jgi:hypothetical protein
VHIADALCCRFEKYGFNLTAVGQTVEHLPNRSELKVGAVEKIWPRLEQALDTGCGLFD